MARKPRILYILNTLGGGGSEMLTLRIIHGLSSAGFEFAVVSLVSDGTMAQDMGSVARLYMLGHQGGIRPSLALRLRRIIRQERPHIVHSHHIAPVLYAWLSTRSLWKRPRLIHTVHVLPELHHQYGNLSRKAVCAYHFLLRRVDHVVCVARYERERLLHALGIPPCSITAIPNGIDLSKFRPSSGSVTLREELGIPPNALVVTCVGAFRRQKNQTCLIEAFHLLLKHRQDVVLLLVGGTAEDRSPLWEAQERVKSLGLESSVRFLGPRPDVPQILAITDVYAQPSLYEGLPLSVMEAMAMQRAIVATDVGGNNELIREGQTGLLVPKNDPQALCHALLRLLGDAGLRVSLGAAARDLVSKDYTESCMIERYEMLYRILARRSSNG